jgi:hypothetical protein
MLAPQVAHAATVEGRYYEDIRDSYGSVSIDDPKGRANDLRIYGDEGRIVVRERGSGSLTAKGNCRKESRRVVSCPSKDSSQLRAATRAGSDELRVDYTHFLRASLSGGPGDDRLKTRVRSTLDGGSGRDVLLGSPRGDTLYGGANADHLRGGRGKDELLGDETQGARGEDVAAKPARDFLDGGRGRDAASWKRRTTPVHVDLRERVGGARGEGDSLRSIESAVGGRGDDRLLGNGRANSLLGGPGSDILFGRAGDDRIDGGTTRRPYAHYWADPPDSDGDLIKCGAGDRDYVQGVGTEDPERRTADPLPQSCELMRREHRSEVVPRLRLGADRVRVPLSCERHFCDLKVTLRSAGDELGKTGRRRFEGRRTVTVKLERPLQRGSPITVVIAGRSMHTEDGDGRRYHFEFRLRRPTAAARAR